MLRLRSALEAAGWGVWVDEDDIPPAAEWRDELAAGIRTAHTFVFVLSPDSVASEYCQWELAQAVSLGKRLIPVVFRPVDEPPEELAARQYVFMREQDDFESVVRDTRHGDSNRSRVGPGTSPVAVGRAAVGCAGPRPEPALARTRPEGGRGLARAAGRANRTAADAAADRVPACQPRMGDAPCPDHRRRRHGRPRRLDRARSSRTSPTERCTQSGCDRSLSRTGTVVDVAAVHRSRAEPAARDGGGRCGSDGGGGWRSSASGLREPRARCGPPPGDADRWADQRRGLQPRREYVAAALKNGTVSVASSAARRGARASVLPVAPLTSDDPCSTFVSAAGHVAVTFSPNSRFVSAVNEVGWIHVWRWPIPAKPVTSPFCLGRTTAPDTSDVLSGLVGEPRKPGALAFVGNDVVAIAEAGRPGAPVAVGDRQKPVLRGRASRRRPRGRVFAGDTRDGARRSDRHRLARTCGATHPDDCPPASLRPRCQRRRPDGRGREWPRARRLAALTATAPPVVLHMPATIRAVAISRDGSARRGGRRGTCRSRLGSVAWRTAVVLAGSQGSVTALAFSA